METKTDLQTPKLKEYLRKVGEAISKQQPMSLEEFMAQSQGKHQYRTPPGKDQTEEAKPMSSNLSPQMTKFLQTLPISVLRSLLEKHRARKSAQQSQQPPDDADSGVTTGQTINNQ